LNDREIILLWSYGRGNSGRRGKLKIKKHRFKPVLIVYQTAVEDMPVADLR